MLLKLTMTSSILLCKRQGEAAAGLRGGGGGQYTWWIQQIFTFAIKNINKILILKIEFLVAMAHTHCFVFVHDTTTSQCFYVNLYGYHESLAHMRNHNENTWV